MDIDKLHDWQIRSLIRDHADQIISLVHVLKTRQYKVEPKWKPPFLTLSTIRRYAELVKKNLEFWKDSEV